MVTSAQLSRLDSKIDALTAAIDPDSEAITVVVFAGETREFALAHHRELRPDHAGRRAVVKAIEEAGRGLTVGERMLRDAHGWDVENGRPNRSSWG